MALVIKDRVRETTSTNGTGTIALAGAVLGYDSFSDIGNANTTYYCIANPGTVEWEVGLGTYSLAGTSLARNTVLASSNSNALVNFSAGVKDVFCTYPAGKSVYLDSAGLVAAASGLGAGIPAFLATPTSANLAAAVTNETGSGSLVFATSPTLVTPNLGTPSTLVGTNITGTAAGLSIGGNAATATTATNQSGGSVNATTGAFSGALTSTSTIQTSAGYVASGVGSGATALTTNDGYGNANLTFNHTNGIPDVTGSSARIVASVDSPTSSLIFQVGNNTTSGVVVALSTVLNLSTSAVSTLVPLSVTGTATATSFSGAGTGLTGTASGLSIGGNAGTSTTLQTARTLTIGDTGKTFNGSANVAWSLAEIGAQAAGNYVTTDTTQTITGLKTISVNTASDAFRITQVGTGNALVVEDSANPDSSPFVVDASGNVGIGTSAPTDKLQVNTQDGVRLGASGSVSYARIGSASTGESTAEVSYERSTGSTIFSQGSTGSALNERMRITNTGNVGIGIAAPTQKLHVSGNILATGSVDCGTQFLGLAADSATAPSFSFTGDTNTGIFQPGADQIGVTTGGTLRFTVSTTQLTSTLPIRGQNGTVAAPAFSASGDTNTGIYFPAADTLAFVEGGVEAMRIDSAGDVGIGKTNPVAKLDVSTASTTTYGLISQTPTVGLVAGDYVNMAYIANSRGASNDGLRIVNVRDSTGSGTGDWQTESYRIRRSVDQSDGSTGVQEEIVFGQSILGFNTSGSERMRISSAGNVGIGNTTSGSYKLEVTGNFYASGTLATGNISGTQTALQVDPAGTAVALAIALG